MPPAARGGRSTKAVAPTLHALDGTAANRLPRAVSSRPARRRRWLPAFPRPAAIRNWILAPTWALLAALVAPAASGQIPVRPAAPASAVKPEQAETIEQQRARLTALLEQARVDRDRLAADSVSAGALAGLAPDELSSARNALAQWVTAVEGQLLALDEVAAAGAARRAAEQAVRDWTGLDTPPPYSILLADELAEAVEASRARIEALTVQRTLTAEAMERARGDVERSEAALRLAREQAPVGRGDDPALRQWRARVAEWSAAAAAAQYGLFHLALSLNEEHRALEGERLKLAERRREAAVAGVRFTEGDLAQVRRIQQRQLERLRAQREAASQTRRKQELELASATEGARRLEADAAADPAAVAIARARLRAATAEVDAVRSEIEAIDALAAVARSTTDLFPKRHQALTDADAGRRREAVLWLRDVGTRVRPWRQYALSQLELLRAEERESGLGVERDPSPQVRAYDAATTAAIRSRIASAQRMLDAAERAERTVARWLAEIDAAGDARPWSERLAAAWATARNWARQVWTFELFAVEDTIEVGGQKITTTSGVTIGKSVGAVMLFMLGYWMAAVIARRIERLLIGRFAVAPEQARTVRRWALALWTFVLLVLTLNLARIPLTVFAFLGGALAIGVGFGTQTIIRNFISGLIVLMERHVRVGDTIEVDGVTGTVTEVNLRSSTVRGFDGVEAIVPNSNLLENKVTNWTHTDNRVRRVIRVGVAYGSPVRQAADLLAECLQRHGLVLKEPEPLVLFEDFADSALVFAMYFWIEIRPGVNSTLVMSDLRFMVHKALDEAGIAMPFPQRDVHLDVSRPVPVRIAGAAPAGD